MTSLGEDTPYVEEILPFASYISDEPTTKKPVTVEIPTTVATATESSVVNSTTASARPNQGSGESGVGVTTLPSFMGEKQVKSSMSMYDDDMMAPAPEDPQTQTEAEEDDDEGREKFGEE
jgi:hypothetical protein